jgi:hypothetical protein
MAIQVLLGLMEDVAATLLWEDATYTPLVGSAVTVRVNPKQPDVLLSLGETRLRTTTTVFQVRVSELANPVKGATITYGGTAYTISAPPMRNLRRRLWIIETNT